MIYILLPTFGRIEETKKFLKSINNSIRKNYLVLIIDDHPKKITLKNIQQNNQIKVFTSKKEIWWVGSINLGIQIVLNNYNLNKEDIVIFANNDVEIDKSSFDILHNEIKKNNNQIIHPRTFDQKKIEVSSGSKILSFFPYVTRHPKNFAKNKVHIDMGTARFLVMSGYVLKKVRYINKALVQYGGDNDFTLSAKRFYKIRTYIIRDAVCELDNSHTGLKNNNIQNSKELFKSFFSIKSPNNFRFRYRFFKKFFGHFFAFFITLNMTINTIIKFIIRKLLPSIRIIE